MNNTPSKQVRVLGIAPSSRGFGFALMEGNKTLVDWGVKTVKGDKNARSLANVGNLVAHYKPDAIALEDTRSEESRRSSRIQTLVQEIIDLAKSEKIKVKLFSRNQVRRGLLVEARSTNHKLAESLSLRFPEQLGCRLPRKRKIWMSEDYRMDIFQAVALAQCLVGIA